MIFCAHMTQSLNINGKIPSTGRSGIMSYVQRPIYFRYRLISVVIDLCTTQTTCYSVFLYNYKLITTQIDYNLELFWVEIEIDYNRYRS